MAGGDIEGKEYPDGSRYLGQMKDGKPHGRGELWGSDGRIDYKGDWFDGYRDGRGVGYGIHGELLYDGNWMGGMRHGIGILYDSFGHHIGQFQFDKKHGKGTILFYDREETEQPPAEIECHRIYGWWRDGQMHGNFTGVWCDGKTYSELEFKEGRINGYGWKAMIPWEPNGPGYRGFYKDGKWHGQGASTERDGSRIEGEYNRGYSHGLMTRYNADGTIFGKGEYDMGKFIGGDDIA